MPCPPAPARRRGESRQASTPRGHMVRWGTPTPMSPSHRREAGPRDRRRSMDGSLLQEGRPPPHRARGCRGTPTHNAPCTLLPPLVHRAPAASARGSRAPSPPRLTRDKEAAWTPARGTPGTPACPWVRPSPGPAYALPSARRGPPGPHRVPASSAQPRLRPGAGHHGARGRRTPSSSLGHPAPSLPRGRPGPP